MEIDIIILFYNKVNQTINCVNSFLSSGQKIYVLDNGSDGAQLKKLKATFENNAWVIILEPGKNLGVSCGRNYLLQHTKSEWIFSVDNDIVIKNNLGWIDDLDCFCRVNPKVKIITPNLFNVHENDYSLQLNVKLEDNKLQIVTGNFPVSNCFPGGAVIIHRSVFQKYGLFDEDMFVGFEDYEFALRALLSNNGPLEVYAFDKIMLIHDHQFQKRSKDKIAVRERYSEDKMKVSYQRLIKKYKIDFDHDFEWWSKKQVASMTVPRWKQLLIEFVIKLRR
jgi:GT2 family glycosyltransferase